MRDVDPTLERAKELPARRVPTAEPDAIESANVDLSLDSDDGFAEIIIG